MTYLVMADFIARTPCGDKQIKKGQVVRLPEEPAQQLIQKGKIKPLHELKQQHELQKSGTRQYKPTQHGWELNERIGLPDMNPNKHKCLQCNAIAGRYCFGQDLKGKWLWGWMCLKCCPYNEPERN